jgi:hypothetical protein
MTTNVAEDDILFENAAHAQTDMEKLKSCQVDLRLIGVCFRVWLIMRQLPQFFVIKIHV